MSESESDLRQAMARLTEYFLGDLTLAQTLERVADTVPVVLPQTDYVGITMMVDGRPTTTVFTDPDVREIDRAQYETGEGPCLDAFRDGRPYVVTSMLEPGERWRHFRDVAARHQMLSSLSLPLTTEHGPVGAMNLYSRVVCGYAAHDVELGSRLSRQAAFVLANAQEYWNARTLSDQLQQAMTSRSVIEQAKGIIMAAQRLAADDAMDVLIRQSQHQNIKVRQVAAEIVGHASARRGSVG
jgi:GAF domain-containing protein